VSQATVVTRLAMRELWITFRLLALLAGFIGVGAVVALLPAPLPTVLERLALGLGAASILAAALAAWSFGDERARGRAAWLVTRSVSRGTVLGGWFAALASLALVGTAVAGLIGWLAASAVSLRLDVGTFAAPLVGVGATVLAAIALGLLVGTVLRGPLAIGVAVAIGVGLGALAWLGPGAGELVPGAALVDLAAVREGAAAPVAGLRAAGAALVATALLLVVARLLLERAEL
jgi:ABC-type transport system involved in multi-copper enzyme maturation permease subunit